jgi:flagellar assembly protein FliH
MTSSRRETSPRQVPAPANSRTAASYTRFIPREELQDFASWTPGAFNTPAPEQSVWPAGQAPTANTPAAAPTTTPATAPAAAAPPPPSAQELADAHEAALEAALRAELEAEFEQRLQQEAAVQAQAARQQGYQDGYRDGLVALDSFKQSFAQQTSAQIGTLVLSLDGELRALEQQMAATVAHVATELARQVVRSELATRPALVAQVAQEAINTVLMSARHITVQVHPDDHAMVAQGCAEALAARGARLLANPAVARGGCVVDTDAGTIDARIAQRWQRATQALGTGLGWSDDDTPGADA